MTSLLSSPEPPPLWSDDERPPHPPPRHYPPPRPRRRRPLALLLVTSAMLGGAASTGVLAATGQLDRAPAQTVTTTTVASQDGGLDARALYASTSAGVVDITVTGRSSASPLGGPQQSQGSGSGFVIDKDGHIVTASHVVDGAASIEVTFEDGSTRTAELLGQDEATDVAVLKVDPSGLTLKPLELGSSASLQVGDEVAAIGDPFGYDRSISTGIVSGVDRTIEAPNGFTVAHAIQTDAAMNPGNSGGPVLDADGRVVGIADQIATNGSSEQSSGVGFAVPIDLVKSSLETLKAGGDVRHAWFGIATGGSDEGAVIAQVTAGGPADQAGLRAGDVVTEFDGRKITDANALVAAIAAHQPDDEVDVTVNRDGEAIEVTVRLGTQPARTG